MDPESTKDGRPYGPIRYKEIVKECYLISKNINTSYTDVLKITPVERQYILSFLMEEAQRHKEDAERRKAEREANRHSY